MSTVTAASQIRSSYSEAQAAREWCRQAVSAMGLLPDLPPITWLLLAAFLGLLVL